MWGFREEEEKEESAALFKLNANTLTATAPTCWRLGHILQFTQHANMLTKARVPFHPVVETSIIPQSLFIDRVYSELFHWLRANFDPLVLWKKTSGDRRILEVVSSVEHECLNISRPFRGAWDISSDVKSVDHWTLGEESVGSKSFTQNTEPRWCQLLFFLTKIPVQRTEKSSPTIKYGTRSRVESVYVIWGRWFVRTWCVRMWVTAGPRGSRRASAAPCAWLTLKRVKWGVARGSYIPAMCRDPEALLFRLPPVLFPNCVVTLQKEYVSVLPDKVTSQPTFVQQNIDSSSCRNELLPISLSPKGSWASNLFTK